MPKYRSFEKAGGDSRHCPHLIAWGETTGTPQTAHAAPRKGEIVCQQRAQRGLTSYESEGEPQTGQREGKKRLSILPAKRMISLIALSQH